MCCYPARSELHTDLEKGKILKLLRLGSNHSFPLKADIQAAHMDAIQFNRLKSEHELMVVLFGSQVRLMPCI